MADRKISDLTALTTPASGDYVPIVDISEVAAASKNKRITIEELFQGIPVNVGIGTSSPGGKLEILQDSTTNTTPAIKITGSAGDPTNYYMEVVPSLSGSLVNYRFNVKNITTYNDVLCLSGSGRVGIGTTSPGAILHTVNTSAGAATVGAFIQNSSLTAGTEVRLGFAPNTNVVGDNRYSWIGAVNGTGSNDSSLTFATTPGGTGATERMRITSAGLVGIGTSSPSVSLEVRGAPDTTGTTNGLLAGITNPGLTAAQINSTTIGIGIAGQAVNHAGDFHLRSFWGFSIDKGAGNLSEGAGNSVNADSRTFAIRQFAGGTTWNTQFCVNGSGNVGIGTTSPSSLLHLADAGDITVGTTTGTKIGTATTQKIGFYNATPVVQPTAVADATDAATVITQLNALLAKLRTLGIIAT